MALSSATIRAATLHISQEAPRAESLVLSFSGELIGVTPAEAPSKLYPISFLGRVVKRFTLCT